MFYYSLVTKHVSYFQIAKRLLAKFVANHLYSTS